MKKLMFMLLILLVAACTSTNTSVPSPDKLAAEKGYVLGEEVEKINNYRVSGWSYVSDRALIISGGLGEKYLLTLNTPCYELRTSEVIGYTTTLNNILSRFDSLVVKSYTQNTRQECHIDRIYNLSEL